MPVLFDSSLYIRALRGDGALMLQRWARETPLWLSAVVLEELYAGAKPGDHRILEKLERDFGRAGRILIPNLSDWSNAGRFCAPRAEARIRADWQSSTDQRCVDSGERGKDGDSGVDGERKRLCEIGGVLRGAMAGRGQSIMASLLFEQSVLTCTLL